MIDATWERASVGDVIFLFINCQDFASVFDAVVWNTRIPICFFAWSELY